MNDKKWPPPEIAPGVPLVPGSLAELAYRQTKKTPKTDKALHELQSLADRLRFARQMKEYSQEVAAASLFVSRAAISQWETGEAQPAGRRLRDIASSYDVSLEWLLTGDIKFYLRFQNPEDAARMKRVGRLTKRLKLDLQTVPERDMAQAREFRAIPRSIRKKLDRHFAVSFMVNMDELDILDCFAIEIEDGSMEPDFHAGDAVVIYAGDYLGSPEPGQIILACPSKDAMPVLRKYRITRIDDEGTPREVELVPANPDWAPIRVTDPHLNLQFIGYPVELHRPLLVNMR